MKYKKNSRFYKIHKETLTQKEKVILSNFKTSKKLQFLQIRKNPKVQGNENKCWSKKSEYIEIPNPNDHKFMLI